MNIEALNALQAVLGKQACEIVLHEPTFVGNEWKYVKDCIDSGWVSSVGEYVTSFEKAIAEYTKIPYVVAVVNGTAALHVCLLLADVQRDDEVLIPALTFVATANAVAYCGAIPHFIEASENNLGVDIEKLRNYLSKIAIVRNNQCFNIETNRRIKAVVPVHIFGHPVDMVALNELAKEYCLTVVEDATESLGSYYQEQHTGFFGDIACLSFNGNKIITTGGGGAILTHNEEWAKRAKHLTTTGKRAHKWEFFHDVVAYNYRLPNINAALGCAQMEQLPEFVEMKRNLAKSYQEAFAGVKDVKTLSELPLTKSNYWLNALIIENPAQGEVNAFIEAANEMGYKLRGLWTPLDRLPMFQNCPKMDLSVTAKLFDSVISLPSSPRLGIRE